MSKKLKSETMLLLSVMRQEATLPKVAFFLLVILLTGNLNAIVDGMLHPEIPYFDAEHLIIGGLYALLVCFLFLGIGIYYAMRKQEEDEIKRAKEEWERTFDAITEPIMMLDTNHTIVKVNKAMADKLGVTPSEARGLTCYKAVHGLQEPHPSCPHSKLLADGQVHSAEIYEERLGGYFIITVSPIYDSKGRLTGSIHAGLDITKRIEAEKKLKESEEKYRDIFGHARDIIFTLNKDTLYTSLNPAFEKLTGWQREEWLGKPFAPILHPDDLPKAVGVFQKIMQGERVEMFELRVLKKSGEYFIGEFTVSPIKQGETVTAALGHVRDITERKTMEYQLKEYSEQLEDKVNKRTKALEEAVILSEAANRAKSEFLANMSHELTTPLNAVIGFSQVLKDGLYGELNDKQKEYVNDILQGGLHLFRILNEIIELARLESDREEIKSERFLLKDAIKSSVAVFNDKAIKRNLKLILEIEPDAEIEIETDSGKLTRILYNLIDNAVKFTPDGGSVSVKARKLSSSELRVLSSESEEKSPPLAKGDEGGFFEKNSELNRNFVEVSVADTGIGIKSENIDKLFQPFSQFESPYTKKYAGTGIGLILIKRLVELLGGNIWVESEFGKGSKFTFTIPVLRGEL